MVDYHKLSDQELLVLLTECDQLAYAEIYNRYKTVLYLHSYRMLHDEEEAKDLVQEMFAVLWAKKEQLKISSSFQAYLYSSIKNRILDHMAHQKVVEKYTTYLSKFVEEGIDADDERIMDREIVKLIEYEIAQLPKKMREIFEMSRYEGLSYRQIAEKLNISDKTVKKQISNATNILKPKIRFNVIFFLYM